MLTSFLGGVEAAVSITVCSTPVIIPAVLRALGAGDPFMREDAVDSQYSTGLEIARMTFATVELNLPTSGSTRTTDSAKLKGGIDTLVSRQQNPADSDVGGDQKYRILTRISSGPLGGLKPTTVVLPIGDSDTADSLCSPVEKKDLDSEGETGER